MSMLRKIVGTSVPFAGVRALGAVALATGLLFAAPGGVGIAFAAVDSLEGDSPPCGSDGICNLAACNQDPDCPADLPVEDEPAGDDGATGSDTVTDLEVIDCDSTQSKDIRAVAWNIVDDWANFERTVEDATDKNLGNCIENRFSTNGKVQCVSEYNCNDKGCKLGFASGLKRRIKLYQTFFDNIAVMPQADRRACYAGLITHEFSHSCDRFSDGANSAAELREDAAFDYWKNRFPVSSDLSANYDCGFD